MQNATLKRKRFGSDDLEDAKEMIEAARAALTYAKENPVEDQEEAATAVIKARVELNGHIEHAAKIVALLANKEIIKSAKLANETIAFDIARSQSKDAGESRQFSRQSEDMRRKAKRAASKAVDVAKANMPELDEHLAGGDVRLRPSGLPVFTLQCIDDDYIPGCSALDDYDRRGSFY
jgi:hypothetical protein